MVVRTRRVRNSRRHAAIALALAVWPGVLRAQETPPPDRPAAPYARTPDRAVPYRNFADPYTRFFQKVMPFRGPGSESAPEAAPDTVRIGWFGPVGSAPDADLGEQMLEGVTLAIEQANAAGGYRGIPFERVQRVDSGLWGASSNEMVAFRYEDRVWAVIGSIDGANTHIALRVALKVEMPMVNTASTDPTLTETNIPWLLRCVGDDRQQGYALAHHVFQECGLSKVVALRANDRYGRTGIAEFRDAARRLGRPLRLELRWQPGERAFDVQLDRIADSGAEAVVLWGNAADTAAIVSEIRRREMPLRIFGGSRLASRKFLTAAGPAADGVAVAATYDPTRNDPRLKAFTTAFSARFQREPEEAAAHAYDGANLLITAIRQAGLNRARIRDALFDLTHYDGVTGPIEFDTTLNDVGPVYIATVESGKFVYRPVDFASEAEAVRGDTPYRILAQSPPRARSPINTPVSPAPAHRIGCFVPLDETGRAAVRGARMALDELHAEHPGPAPVELLVRDARGAWGTDPAALVDLVTGQGVLAVVGSSERRGTHLAEMLAAKLHFPVVTLCGDDPTVTQIPLPWVFRVAAPCDIEPGFAERYRARFDEEAGVHAAWGYDAAQMLASEIHAGSVTRLALRNALAGSHRYAGVSGAFSFDALGNRRNLREGGTR